jgi:hypothetical protein
MNEFVVFDAGQSSEPDFNPHLRQRSDFELLTLRDRLRQAFGVLRPSIQAIPLTWPRIPDLSHWNTIEIDNLDGDMVWLKASEATTYVDPMFEVRWRGLLARGKRIGAYHFFRGNVDGIAQAQHFLSVIEPLRQATEGAMLIAGDFETADDVSLSTRQSRAYQFLDHLRSHYRNPFMYTSQYLWSSLYGNPVWGDQFYGWVAQWANIDAPSLIPGGWDRSKVLFWQNGIWDDHGWIAPWFGASPDIDNNHFMGTLAELDQLIGIQQPEPIPPPVGEVNMVIAKTSKSVGPGAIYPDNAAILTVPPGKIWQVKQVAGTVDRLANRIFVGVLKGGAMPGEYMPLIDEHPTIPMRWYSMPVEFVLEAGDILECRAIGAQAAQTLVQVAALVDEYDAAAS